MRPAAQERIICSRNRRFAARQRLFLVFGQFDRKCISEATGDFVLQCENVVRRSIEAFGPDVTVGNGVDELGVDPDLLRRALNAAFEDIAHTQFLGDLARIDPLSLVGECRVARDHEQAGTWESPVIRSSVMPSAKYSCCWSPLIFANGSTAIEGLSGSGRSGLNASAHGSSQTRPITSATTSAAEGRNSHGREATVFGSLGALIVVPARPGSSETL